MNGPAQFSIIAGFTLAAAGATWLMDPPSEPKSVVCDPALIEPYQICLSDVPEDVLWIDARSRSEWEQNGLEGSILWNLDPDENGTQLEAEAAMRIIAAPLVVVYCGSEACGTSRQIAEMARALDLGPPVKALFGGWDAIRDSSSGK